MELSGFLLKKREIDAVCFGPVVLTKADLLVNVIRGL